MRTTATVLAAAVGVTVLGAALLPAQPGTGKKTDAERLVGVWRVTKICDDGKDIPKLAGLPRLTFAKDGTAVLGVTDEGQEGTYKLAGPGQIDITLRDDTQLGVYKFDGDDHLTVCVGDVRDGAKRPTEFTSESGSRRLLLVLERAKPGQEKLTPAEIARAREAVWGPVSANNLKQIALGMHGYQDVHKHLPFHAIYGKDGKPLLSWRVAILPYAKFGELYKQFKLDEPWDSRHNKALVPLMPAFYQPVNSDAPPTGMTYYQVFTGPDTVFDGTKKISLRGIRDGEPNTLMVVEANEPVEWTRPVDLVLPNKGDKLPALGGMFKNGMNVLFCDGSVRWVRRAIDPATLRALITPDGKEDIDFSKLDP